MWREYPDSLGKWVKRKAMGDGSEACEVVEVTGLYDDDPSRVCVRLGDGSYVNYEADVARSFQWHPLSAYVPNLKLKIHHMYPTREGGEALIVWYNSAEDAPYYAIVYTQDGKMCDVQYYEGGRESDDPEDELEYDIVGPATKRLEDIA